MKLNDKQKRAASFGIVGVLAWFSGTFVPPEMIAEILGAF